MRPPADSTFADRVRDGLRLRGLGLREFCRAVGLDPSFISKVLSGKRSPPSDEAALRRIAGVLGLDAPGLIVAAGRIPGEWRRLGDDPAVFEAVNRLASGAPAAADDPGTRAPAAQGAARGPAAAAPPAFSTEPSPKPAASARRARNAPGGARPPGGSFGEELL